MREFLAKLMSHPQPLRLVLWRRFLKHFPGVSYPVRLASDAVDRPHYGYCLYHSALLAKRLGYDKVSAIEFGVAGGNGLIAIEKNVKEIEKELDIKFEIYGFDIGSGLPEPQDYRDLPYWFKGGFYEMDKRKLLEKLTISKLVIGNVKETCRNFLEEYKPAPIGCVFHDLDYYSSTRDALDLFDGPENYFLPRIFCYFDDIIGGDIDLYNDFTGERLAINEFNKNHNHKKIAMNYHLVSKRPETQWRWHIFVYHDFLHKHYNSYVGGHDQEMIRDSLHFS